MANLLSRFNKQVIGSDVYIYDYLPKITATGDFKRVRDIDVIISSWNNILTTQRRTYFFDPEYVVIYLKFYLNRLMIQQLKGLRLRL